MVKEAILILGLPDTLKTVSNFRIYIVSTYMGAEWNNGNSSAFMRVENNCNCFLVKIIVRVRLKMLP